MTTKNKKTRRYGNYIVNNNGELYAAVHLPLGGGKYKKKCIRLSKIGGTPSAAAKWATGELFMHQTAQMDEKLFELFTDVKGGGIGFDEFKQRVLRLEK